MKKEKIKTKIKSNIQKKEENEDKRYLNYNKLSEYIKSNKQSFQNLENKNYSLAKNYFEKCVEISKELDQIKYIESLINYSLSLYFNNEIHASYSILKKAKDLSFALYKESEEINQIYFIYLRIISNMCLISLNLNKISESGQLFHQCISLIKDPKITDIKIQLSMLRELIYIFYRIDSLRKFDEINAENINLYNNYQGNIIGINNEIKLGEKGLYYLYKSFKNNDLNDWLDYLNKELNENNIKDINGYAWLLINRFIVLYYQKEEGSNDGMIKKAFNELIKFIEDNFEYEINIDNNKINKLYFYFKNNFNILVKYYNEISNLENELNDKLNESIIINDKNLINKENKILIKLLLKNSIKILNINWDNSKDIIKTHLKDTLKLIENNQINWELLSILNINKDLIESIKTLFHNLIIIKEKLILRNYFFKFKLTTLGYKSPKEKLEKRYEKSESLLKNQLKTLEEGSMLTKINYTSKGYNEHFFRLYLIDNEYYFSVHKTISDLKPYKVFNLKELNNITIGIQTDNLKDKFNDNLLKEFKPWCIMSLWFKERTYDLYFDNEDEMNKWFEAIYYYNKYIIGKHTVNNLGYFFFNKLKLKMLYKLKNVEHDLPIIEKLKYYSELNGLEYFTLPFPKCLILYLKVYNNIIE